MKISVLLFLLTLSSVEVHSQLTKADILSDIDTLEQLIKEKHVAPFWLNSEKNIEKVFATSRISIDQIADCDERCLVEFFKIVAAVKDGHSTISGDARYELFGYLPISTRWFNGELRVMRTIDSYKETLGSKITAVNDHPIKEVLEKLNTIVPQANKYRFQKFVGSYLHLPGLLFGLGITADAEQASFTFEKEGIQFEITLKNLSPEEEENAQFISYLELKKESALYQRNNSDYYWHQYNPENELFYFQFNRVGNMKKEGISNFAQRMWDAVDSVDVNKFVLDLRYNGGGSFPYSLRIIQGILDRLDINRRGRLFIITGYDTFSAAMDMLNILELKSQAIIVGEYPCDHPSRPGDPERYKLPSTGISVYLSSLYHPTAITLDGRTTSSLDAEIVTTWNDYSTGRDPVLEFIEDYGEPTEQIVPSNEYVQSLGNYPYSPTRDIRLKDVDGQLLFEITHALITPVYLGKDQKFNTEIPGLQLEIGADDLKVYFPDGRTENYSKWPNSRKAPVDYLYEGNLVSARKEYLKLKKTNADFIEFEDHMMSFLSTIVYFELLKYPYVNASEVALGILNLGIKMNDGNAPFCQYSLRFYQ